MASSPDPETPSLQRPARIRIREAGKPDSADTNRIVLSTKLTSILRKPTQVSDGPDRRSAYLDSRDLENPETGLLGSPSQPGTEQTSRLGDEERESAHADIFNPDRPGFHVYDDSRPASSQPQTPQNLPEARHRSRLLGAFTAPAAGTGSATRPSGRTPRSSRRWALRRSPSPEGLSTPGFRGLYGGLENSDDATLFEQALMRIGQPRRSDASPGQQSS